MVNNVHFFLTTFKEGLGWFREHCSYGSSKWLKTFVTLLCGAGSVAEAHESFADEIAAMRSMVVSFTRLKAEIATVLTVIIFLIYLAVIIEVTDVRIAIAIYIVALVWFIAFIGVAGLFLMWTDG